MANLAKSAVALVDRWTEGGLAGRKFQAKQVTLTLTGQGTVANNIPASVLGMRKIVRAHSFVKSDSAVIVEASPNYDGTLLLLRAAGTQAPADFTGTFRGVVVGREL